MIIPDSALSAAQRIVLSAAQRISQLDPEQLKNPEQIRAWAKAQLMLDQKDRALLGFDRLVEAQPTLETRYERAMALQQMGLFTEAQNALRRLRMELADPKVARTVSPELRESIGIAEMSCALYAPPPIGYETALQIAARLRSEMPDIEDNASFQVALACAYGQKFRDLTEDGREQAERDEVRRKALDAVKKAIEHGEADWIRYLSSPDDPRKAKQTGVERDDDLEIFADDPEFKALLANAPASG